MHTHQHVDTKAATGPSSKCSLLRPSWFGLCFLSWYLSLWWCNIYTITFPRIFETTTLFFFDYSYRWFAFAEFKPYNLIAISYEFEPAAWTEINNLLSGDYLLSINRLLNSLTTSAQCSSGRFSSCNMFSAYPFNRRIYIKTQYFRNIQKIITSFCKL